MAIAGTARRPRLTAGAGTTTINDNTQPSATNDRSPASANHPTFSGVTTTLQAVIFLLRLLFSGTAARRSALARIEADGTPIGPLGLLLRCQALLDFIGMDELCEAEQRFAVA